LIFLGIFEVHCKRNKRKRDFCRKDPGMFGKNAIGSLGQVRGEERG
jgi:hypothetical protein